MRSPRTPTTPPAYPGPAWRSQPWAGPRPSSLARIARLLRRRRRLVAALLLCAATATAVHQLTPASPAVTIVVLAAHDLPAGHLLRSADLIAGAVSPQMVPDGALTPPQRPQAPPMGSLQDGDKQDQNNAGAWVAAWEGQHLSGPVRRGEVLTDASLLGNGLLVGSPAGSQAVPLRLSDPSTLTLLRQGQLVTVVLSSSTGFDGPVSNELLAEKVPVLWTPALSRGEGGLLPGQDNEGVVVVAASAEQAVRLAGAISRGKVSLILLN